MLNLWNYIVYMVYMIYRLYMKHPNEKLQPTINENISKTIVTCQLCYEETDLVTLQCNHILCCRCLETQKLYVSSDCLICENLN